MNMWQYDQMEAEMADGMTRALVARAVKDGGAMRLDASHNAQSRYWIGVVSASHVKRGTQGGFAQLCHGKAAPLRRMRPGDWLIYYSPRTDMADGEPLQAFTAIGQVEDDAVYEFQMSDSFVPYRRNIRYAKCREARIAPLLNKLSFTRDKRSWGYAFRFGHLEMSREDFLLIAAAMLDDEGEAL